MKDSFKKIVAEPYRLFFPSGIIYLLWGVLIWLPMLWNPNEYPVEAHRYLMLNGFSATFIAGFLMTAVKFAFLFSALHYKGSIAITVIAIFFWRLFKLPKEKAALTKCLWISCCFIIISFFLKAFWLEGLIHASHASILSGIVLLSLLIATRVLQSHGPKDKYLENLNLLYVVTFLVLLAGATRISAYWMPAHYLRHLDYSSLVLTLAVVIWPLRYIPFVLVSNGGRK